MAPKPRVHPNARRHSAAIQFREDCLTPMNTDGRGKGAVVRDSASSAISQGYTPHVLPTQFQDDVDVAGCALDEQLEQMQRHYAAACRAASRARFEIESLQKHDDIPDHMINQAKRQRAAAETRCARLLSAIEALEDRLENE
jgi:septal ring factor EnvC (AmiA/AmiB activator)